MATNPKRPSHGIGPSLSGKGPGKWILSAFGFVWIVRLATRALHRHRVSPDLDQPRSPRLAGDLAGAGLPSTASWRPVRGHENRDANHKWIFGIVLFLFVSGLVIQGILSGLLSALVRTPPPTDAWRPLSPASAKTSPSPRLQISPPAELKAFRRHEEAELHSYGWINRTTGVVRIPIERALDLVLQEGLPARTGTNLVKAGPSSYQLIERRAQDRLQEMKGDK